MCDPGKGPLFAHKASGLRGGWLKIKDPSYL